MFLRRALSESVPNPKDPEKKISRKRLMARMLADAVISGVLTLPDRSMTLDYDQWLSTVRLIHDHLDGPPPKELDVTSHGEQLKGFIGISPDDWDEPGDEA